MSTAIVSADESAIGGEILAARSHAPKRFSSGRVCEHERCQTRLSIYNSRRRCALHDFDSTLVKNHASVAEPKRGPVAEPKHESIGRTWHRAA